MLLLMLPLVVVVVVLDASGSGDGGALEVFSSCRCWLCAGCCTCKLAPAGSSRKDVVVMHKQKGEGKKVKKRENTDENSFFSDVYRVRPYQVGSS